MANTRKKHGAVFKSKIGVAARNHKRSDAQSRGYSDADCLRLNAGSVRRTQDQTFQRKLPEPAGAPGADVVSSIHPLDLLFTGFRLGLF